MAYTLLLADDSATIQRVIELTFADEDVQVVAVSDGDRAIERLESAPPDIVLADVGMPGKNGYEVARYVKQSPKLSHIPVVLLTGAFEPVDQARADEAGCDGILAKPFEPQLVIGRVKELLARPKPSPPANGPGASSAQGTAVASRADELGSYFDRLDAAFARLSAGATAAAAAQSEPSGSPTLTAPPTEPFVADIERFAPEGSANAPVADEASPPELPAASISTVVEPAPIEPPRSPGAASVADDLPEVAGVVPGVPPAPAGLSAVITDDLVEEITRRVLARLTDRVVRETVSDIVSQAAERLVRAEIDRIKASIK